MSTKLSLLTLGLSAVMASGAFAGDIKPLHEALNGDLASGFPKTDKLKGVCPTGTSPAVYQIQARVRDTLPVKAPFVNVRIHRLASNSCTAAIAASGTLQTDPNSNSATGDGNAGLSPYSVVSGANGNAFLIEVSKTSSAANEAETYQLGWHCENGNALSHPVPALTYCQNQ